MTNSIIHLILITCVAILGHVFQRWSATSFVFLTLFVVSDSQVVNVCSFIMFILFICLDAKRKGKNSIFSKYNIYSPDCVFPAKTVLYISMIGCIVTILVVLIRLIGKL